VSDTTQMIYHDVKWVQSGLSWSFSCIMSVLIMCTVADPRFLYRGHGT